MPACSYAAAPIACLKELSGTGSPAAESVAKFGISMIVFGKVGVTVEIDATRTSDSLEPADPPRCRRAYSMDVNTIAAPPSEVAQMSSRRNGLATIGDAITSSTPTSLRYRAYGLFRPWREFFTFTLAKSSSVAPYRSMRRRAYSAKYVGLVAPSRRNRSQSGSSWRSPEFGFRKPFGVVSAPTTSATSHRPDRMRWRAASMAIAPDAHAPYALVTGMPVQPRAWAKVAPAT